MQSQAPTPSRPAARANGTEPQITEATGRKGYRAELEDLRERMRGLALGHDQIAEEIGRRYQVRPREAYRLAHGWTLEEAAARFNARAAKLGTDPEGLASTTGSRLCEYEKWPDSQRRPSAYVLVMLAIVYQTGVLNLLDLPDHEHLPPRDRLTLLRPGQQAPLRPGLPATEATLDTSHAGTAPLGLTPSLLPANGQSLSLTLPYVPGRLVIEVSEPPLDPGQHPSHGDAATPAITALRGPSPASGIRTATAVNLGGRA